MEVRMIALVTSKLRRMAFAFAIGEGKLDDGKTESDRPELDEEQEADWIHCGEETSMERRVGEELEYL